MTRPKIWFVSRKWPPAVGGMETYAVKLWEGLHRHGDACALTLPGRPNGSPPSAWRLAIFGLSSFCRLLAAGRGVRIVHVGDMASWPIALAAVWRDRCGIVLSAHGTDVSYPRRRGWRAWLYGCYLRLGARLLRKALVIANSAATAEAVRENGFRRTLVIRLATDMPTEPVHARCGTDLLFVGRLTPRKGCAWFVGEVLPRLPEGMKLRVAGPIWNAQEAAVLDDPRVEYLGILQGKALAQAYAGALAVVVPNVEMANGEFEGFGLVAVEAAAAGGLVLASRAGGLSDAVLDGVTGFLLPPGDTDAWVEKIRDVAAWPEARRATFLADAGETARREYSWERVVDETRRAYARVL